MNYVIFALTTIALFVFATAVYRKFNHGLSRSARHQQTTRMAVASVLSMLPWVVAGKFTFCWSTVTAGIVSILTMLTYPILYHFANRQTSPDYDNYMDITFGLYFWGLSGALILLAAAVPGGFILSVALWIVETILLVMSLAQIGYYRLYRNVFDSQSVEVVLSTGLNEVLEFMRYYNFFIVRGALLLSIAVVVMLLVGDILWGSHLILSTTQIIIIAIYTAGMAVMMFRGRRSPWRRLGLVELINEVRGFRKGAGQYKNDASTRVATLELEELAPKADKPTTIVLVIGESANRDFMSAFTKMDVTTTPWLESRQSDEDTILFPNAYSCAIQTVPAVRMMLTEANQYSDVDFNKSCSIIDVAHRLGRKVHWYSNQGHLGTFDTPVSMIAETSDVAKWTLQEVDKPQFDETLVDFLDEVDPNIDNLVVLHLKGSHFNYLNRFPERDTVWTSPGMHDDVINYKNAIHYTDKVLGMIYDYGVTKLNMEAMIYVSDHGENPLKRRSPRFDGFENTRIPFMVWLSGDYRRRHPDRAAILRENSHRFFTNDLTYELICSIFDIRSPRFDNTQSIGYREYNRTRDNSLTYEGRIRIADDIDSAVK
ncbi:MAG: phosphoethanolamine transferase [Muribaculum sp.]|nr:phosphoethanolamine transferase [Muribaculum sp.]